MIRARPLQVATIVIAAIFAARAALRLTHPEFNILRFAVLGWPAWSLWAVSLAELAGAVLLVRSATFRLGALSRPASGPPACLPRCWASPCFDLTARQRLSSSRRRSAARPRTAGNASLTPVSETGV